jgi:hypothetical protein
MVLKFSAQKPQEYTPTDSTYTKLLLHGQNLLDYSGNGNDATANGDATDGNSGNPFGFGGVMSGDGSGDYFSLSDSVDFNFGSGDFVIDFRLKNTSSTAWCRPIENSPFNSSTMGWHFSMNTGAGNKIGFQLSDPVSPGNDRIESNSGLSIGTWYHIAVVRSGDTVYMYIDGIQQSSTLDVTGVTMADDHFRMLGDLSGGNLFTGSIAEVRLLKGTDNGWTGSTIAVPTTPYKVV